MGRLADGREVVVKRCPYAVEVEADGLAALDAAGAPVPAVLGVAGHVLALERVDGPPD
jgi:RIO-like serine/threonine protein kinase